MFTLKEMRDHYLAVDRDEYTGPVSREIDHFYNTELNLFEHWNEGGKPPRYHVVFTWNVMSMFAHDRDIYNNFILFGRGVFRRMVRHEVTKLAGQLALVVASAVVAQVVAPALLRSIGQNVLGMAACIITSVFPFAVYMIAGMVINTQYNYRLRESAFSASREMLERTKDLHNIFTEARATADQAETDFAMDGKKWGKWALYLTRLSMWIGARMEYMERFVQMELWRTHREVYFTEWARRIYTSLLIVMWCFEFAFLMISPSDAVASRLVGVVALICGCASSWFALRRWGTDPKDLITGMGIGKWVRHADLDVDDKIADQVRRDKERLVEYRSLTRH